ncbi:xanthine dehydrogenase family protein subunit M [Ferrovibrio sp.]|uniref:FAD binding domain-containing protein n=1 Tax=Ferrovibrio sp. TaxID=1917215 RepID=UPI0025BE4081|nr:xanthine dehydrogenase family protein subunit M [Ferrovibrio sp.]MBX3453615.1 xanthine dehydrogenase family protein subunit M [Ferrovibrio sp.]
MSVQGFHIPQDVAETVALAARLGSEAYFIAGGTDLVIQMRRGRRKPGHLISLQALDGLKQIESGAGLVSLGALVTHKQIETAFAADPVLYGLVESAQVVGGNQVRHAGTIGGNICNASPAADLLPQLLTLDAEVVLTGGNGPRQAKLADFLLGPGRTTRSADELLTHIRFRRPAGKAATAFLKAGRRRAMEISVISVAACIGLSPDGRLEDVRLAVGAAAPMAYRAHDAEILLQGHKPDEDRLSRAGILAASAAVPISDVRASAEHRRRLVAALLPRAIRQCLLRIEKAAQ